jgi:hypothetical protein
MARTYGISLTDFASGQSVPPQPQQGVADVDNDMMGSSDDDVDVPDELAGGAGGSMHGVAGSGQGMFNTAGPSTSAAMRDGAGPTRRHGGDTCTGVRATTAAADSSWALDLLRGAGDDAGAVAVSGSGRRRGARTGATEGRLGPSTSAGVAGCSREMLSNEEDDSDEDDDLEIEAVGAAEQEEGSEEDWMHGEAVDDEATLEEEERLAGTEDYVVRSLTTARCTQSHTHTQNVFSLGLRADFSL